MAESTVILKIGIGAYLNSDTGQVVLGLDLIDVFTASLIKYVDRSTGSGSVLSKAQIKNTDSVKQKIWMFP